MKEITFLDLLTEKAFGYVGLKSGAEIRARDENGDCATTRSKNKIRRWSEEIAIVEDGDLQRGSEFFSGELLQLCDDCELRTKSVKIQKVRRFLGKYLCGVGEKKRKKKI